MKVNKPHAPRPEQLSYADALTELEAIVARLEKGEVDVDDLAGSVKRAVALVEACRARLRSAQADVEAALREVEGSQKPNDEAANAAGAGEAGQLLMDG
jgi:exodeoxyribonuclease VII small subunit